MKYLLLITAILLFTAAVLLMPTSEDYYRNIAAFHKLNNICLLLSVLSLFCAFAGFVSYSETSKKIIVIVAFVLFGAGAQAQTVKGPLQLPIIVQSGRTVIKLDSAATAYIRATFKTFASIKHDFDSVRPGQTIKNNALADVIVVIYTNRKK